MAANNYVLNAYGDALVSETGGMVNWTKDTKTVVVVLSTFIIHEETKTSIIITYKNNTTN